MRFSFRNIAQFILTIIIGVFVAYTYAGDRAESKKEIDSLKNQITELSTSAQKTNDILAERIGGAEATISELAKESKTLSASQVKIEKDSASRISALSNTLKQAQSSFDLTSIVAFWRPYVVQVTCQIFKPTKTITLSGSGMLFQTAQRPYAHIVTNKHILSYENDQTKSCEITLPDITKKISVTSDNFLVSKDETDLAVIDISKKSDEVDARADEVINMNICTNASSGDRVVILGYPSIGTKGDITATEGIISGKDGNYYITSAKIEQGNSGGAAILIHKDGTSCYIGIPTFVDVGKVESLARILSVTAFGK